MRYDLTFKFKSIPGLPREESDDREAAFDEMMKWRHAALQMMATDFPDLWRRYDGGSGGPFRMEETE